MALFKVKDEDGTPIGETSSPVMASLLQQAARDQRQHETQGADDGSGITVQSTNDAPTPVSDRLNSRR
jgi:hypothetical protein